VVSVAACRGILERLAALPEAERREVRGLHPDRAPTIVAGVVMVIEALELFGLDSTAVPDHDILRGAALEVVHRARPNGEVESAVMSRTGTHAHALRAHAASPIALGDARRHTQHHHFCWPNWTYV
jgi:exopolyphosphatase/pppGpp-phosphohydrolase